eukprot:Rhum_TRINITY_DN13399_c0_g1::Rhum_TRINITY_DN13399_c0_g1_i1::g.58869::m.58869
MRSSGALIALTLACGAVAGDTWAGEAKNIWEGGSVSWHFQLSARDLSVATFNAVSLETRGFGGGCAEATFQVTAGCSGANPLCTGLTSNDVFSLGNGGAREVHPDVQIEAIGVVGWAGTFVLSVRHLANAASVARGCRATVVPTLRYASGKRTPAPQTPASSPGFLCPGHESQGGDTVRIAACGAAACRTAGRFPLGRAAQACDPCERGLLPFVMAMQGGADDGYTVAFTFPSGQAVTAEVPCGTCTALRGLSFEVLCDQTNEEGGGTHIVVAAAALGGMLLGLGLAALRCLYKQWCSPRMYVSRIAFLEAQVAALEAELGGVDDETRSTAWLSLESTPSHNVPNPLLAPGCR